MKRQIEEDEALFVETRTTHSSVYDVFILTASIRVVYNHKDKQLVTALPGPNSVQFKVVYKDRDNKLRTTTISADGKLQAAFEVQSTLGAKEVRTVTPIRHK